MKRSVHIGQIRQHNHWSPNEKRHLLLEVFLLIVEGLLHLVHETSLFEQSRCGRHGVDLQVDGQLDLLVRGTARNTSLVTLRILHF